MRKTIKIARAELGSLFYSPIAWILLIIFLVQCSLTFTQFVHGYITIQQLKNLFPGPSRPLTYAIFSDGLYNQMAGKLYLYLPLLTMGLISREFSSGTIRLLYSSPVKTRQIVLGKFLAMTAYNLLLIILLAIFACTLGFYIPHMDVGLLISALIGFLLLLSAYAAIGLFMSCLTSYQVVAALSTLAVFAALQYIGNIWQDIDFVRDLTWVLSLGTRTTSMFAGLISSADVIYFAIIIIMFLGFSVLRLKSDQEARPLWVNLCRYLCLLLASVALGYISSRPAMSVYADLTAPKTNTITSNTQALLRATGDEPLEVTAYVNLLDNHYDMCSPQARNSEYLRFWNDYVRFKPGINFRYVYYYDTTAYTNQMIHAVYKGKTLRQIAQEFAKTNEVSLDRFLTPEQSEQIPGLKQEDGRFVMQMKYKGRTVFVRVFDDNKRWPNEEMIAAALKRLIQPDITPTIDFLKGGLERSSDADGGRHYSLITTAKQLRISLVNNGINVDTISDGQELPAKLSTLVIADPKVPFSATTMTRLQRYIAGGGNLLITGEPGKQSVLNPLLQSLGIQMRGGMLVQQNKDEAPDLITPFLTETTANMSQDAANLYNQRRSVILPGASALDQTILPVGFTLKPLLILHGEKSWLKTGKVTTDSAAVEFNAAEGDLHGDFMPAMALTRMLNGHEQRIIVVGDADFLSNNSLKLYNDNVGFATALFKWTSGGVFPVEVSRLQSKDLKLDMTEDQLNRINTLFVWLIPGLLVATASVLLLRRKRK